MSSRKARECFTFETPDYLLDAAMSICVELDREYPYLAQFHFNDDGTYQLFSLYTVKRSISWHYGEGVSNTGWDVDWIERDKGYVYHQSSGGGSLRKTMSGIYWRHPAMLHGVREETARYCDKAFRKRNKTRRIRHIPIDLNGHEDMMQWLKNTAIDSETYYCTVCKEYLPDRMEDLCEHVWWCDEDAVLRGPGSTDYPEPCDGEDCYYCNREKVTP